MESTIRFPTISERDAHLWVVVLQVHHVSVKGGPNGYSDFVRDIQSIFGITTEHDMQLAFDCADPITGARKQHLTSAADESPGPSAPCHMFWAARMQQAPLTEQLHLSVVR